MFSLATKPEGLVNRPVSQSQLQVVHRHVPSTAITNSVNKSRSWEPLVRFSTGLQSGLKGEIFKKQIVGSAEEVSYQTSLVWGLRGGGI